jgi:hypothetical protein
MTITDRLTGREYQLVKIWDASGAYMEASTLRRYRLVKRYI